MKNKATFTLAAVLAACAFTSPVLADNQVVSLFGASTATVIDTPEGVLVDSLYNVPKTATKGLAEAFGDANGWKQQIVGAVIGIPTGFVFGIPYGACHGMHHAWTTGWDKPFSMNSFIISDNDK